MHLFQKKDVVSALASNKKLTRSLSAWDLIIMGVGVIVGAGIFITPGIIAANYAGPGVIFTYLLAAIVCIGAAFCYSEFASTIPLAGSAYTYSYTIYGEIIAWIIGWSLVAEYLFATSSVAVSWSAYFRNLLTGFGIHLPPMLQSAAGTAGNPAGRFDLIAFIVVFLVVVLTLQGLKNSVRVSTIMVYVKIFVIILFVVVALFFFQPKNFDPLLPYGWTGVGKGASIAFFAFLGFDVVSTASEEVKNPKRNMPIGIISSLLIVSVLYGLVSFALVGAVKYTKLNVSDPVAYALRVLHQNWAAGIISLGAVMGMTTVLIVIVYGGTRLIYSISRDGLLPTNLNKLNKAGIPTGSTILFGLIAALVAAILPLDKITELVNVGTLLAFSSTSLGVLFLNRNKNTKDLEPAFKVPLYPVFPVVAFLACLYLLVQLQAFTWEMFAVWQLIGLVIYFGYGYRHSHLNKNNIN
ncbi:amino acid permease [Companilactobacillus sp.]|jgi:APA family basic amino acid/polyamine antiporter|uniref:amino acid permease n=1 Tax=Companilactobacillus sp. TaxID=2767905 RepID=UPI0025BB4EBB|nr:amino acid permease [Companilactobacillus sp.]MCH4009294.1 amino acid permease [Companilactobacillus sp.]MCH4050527.1 amino acid permease [Companilactobacillus sp.]MCH4077236.1 amino acid permease [Companilactobacillus sp.]MCH4125812.1 amino acid permease [Companilactobacillus sp.]MCI1311521.1 amino acid permease [Companilactobacillus sp.]